jgi:hypothetical protein
VGALRFGHFVMRVICTILLSMMLVSLFWWCGMNVARLPSYTHMYAHSSSTNSSCVVRPN